jgi:fructose-1,6-bisphosphatase/inositol monophosphatase family enzyme
LDLVYAGLASEGWKPWDYCAGLVVATEAGCCMSHLKMENEVDMDEDGNVKCGYDFNLYSKSMICGVERELVEEARNVILG